MKIALFLAAVTIGLSFGIDIIAASYGPKVGGRFLERGEPYCEASLKAFVMDFPRYARRYVLPVLFPCDLLFMIFLGGFLGLSSVEAADSIGELKRMIWVFAIGPAVYVLIDLIEDVLLARRKRSVRMGSRSSRTLLRQSS